MSGESLYRLIPRRGGRTITGDADACAAALGLTVPGFYTLLRRIRAGESPWRAERFTPDWRDEAACEWDRRFGWYPPYPCEGCLNRCLCDREGWYCAHFARWFAKAWDRAAGDLRRQTSSSVKSR